MSVAGGQTSELGGAGFARVRRLAHRLDFSERPGKAVHLPVAGDERAHARGHLGSPMSWIWAGVIIAATPMQSARAPLDKARSLAQGERCDAAQRKGE